MSLIITTERPLPNLRQRSAPDPLRTFERSATKDAMHTSSDRSPLPIDCPHCGLGGHATFGQVAIKGEVRWYRAISCPDFGNVEEDGVGSGPTELRQAVLDREGYWQVRVEGPEKTRAIQVMKRRQHLSNHDAVALLRRFPILPAGTIAEADAVVQMLSANGLSGVAERV